MPFVELSGRGVRNLESFKIRPSEKINIFFGENGAGKTNLLELIYLNSLGKSFRTSQNRSVIKDSEESCVIFSKYTDAQTPGQVERLGLEKHRNSKQKISINGVKDKTVGELAQTVPVLVIQPNELDLIDGSSALRRSYLDWLLFHVEQDFFTSWKKNQKLLKQRNHLLRSAKAKGRAMAANLELKAWDLQFITANEEMRALREPYIKPLEAALNEYLALFSAFDGLRSGEGHEKHKTISIDFFQGWEAGHALHEALEKDLPLDLSKGFTRSGGHRCDLLIRVKQHPAKEHLSRGQKKVLALIMRLAQAKILMEARQKYPVLLIDDLFAELDEKNAKVFCSLLESLNSQVFLTRLGDFDEMSSYFKNPPKKFHVKQGQIKEA